MDRLLACFCLTAALVLPASALADTPQMYKWTDAQGVIHFSDTPPAQAAPDLQTLDIPQFPPVDPAKLAAEQAATTAQLAALQQLLATQAAQQQQAAAAAEQQAETQAALAALQQQSEAPASPPLIYSASAFVPRAYRANLYVFHAPAGRRIPSPSPISKKPGGPLRLKP